jgi:RimJ/RimL family protein N-acetyltransferase
VTVLPLGEPVPGWVPRDPPPYTPMTGRYVTLAPLLPSHAPALLDAADDGVWMYLSYGPFASADEYAAWIGANATGPDPLFYAVVAGGVPSGVLSILRIDAPNGSAEIGHVWYGPAIQRSRATTEATYLVARRVFDECGYRRFEWKCNALNAASRAAAERFGFAYEGTFRKHMVAKGRNRDTAWFAMTDDDWPRVRAAFDAWLDPSNFDADGTQRGRLAAAP